MIEFQSDVHTIVHFFPVLLVLLKFFFFTRIFFKIYKQCFVFFYVLSVVHNSLTRITVFDYFFLIPYQSFFVFFQSFFQ